MPSHLQMSSWHSLYELCIKGTTIRQEKKLSIAEMTSDLQIETEDEDINRRKKRPNPRYESDSDDDVELAQLRKSPRKSVPPRRPASNPPRAPIINPPVPLSTTSSQSFPTLFEEENSLCRKSPRKSTPRRLVSSTSTFPRTPSRTSLGPSSSPTSPSPPALPSLLDRTESRSNIGGFERKLLMLVEEVKVQVSFNTKLLNALLKKIDTVNIASQSDTTEVDGELSKLFPIQTQEEVWKCEDILKDEDMANKMVKFLIPIGGEDMKKTVRRLLAFMFSNKLAREINWMGKGGKLAFSKLKLKEVLSRAVRANRLCADSTHSEIGTVIKEWFRYSCDREGGRKERQERKKEKNRIQSEQNEADST